MANAHRTNVLVTSCLKTPVDPHTKAPVALYERERVLPYSAGYDNRHYEKEVSQKNDLVSYGIVSVYGVWCLLSTFLSVFVISYKCLCCCIGVVLPPLHFAFRHLSMPFRN